MFFLRQRYGPHFWRKITCTIYSTDNCSNFPPTLWDPLDKMFFLLSHCMTMDNSPSPKSISGSQVKWFLNEYDYAIQKDSNKSYYLYAALVLTSEIRQMPNTTLQILLPLFWLWFSLSIVPSLSLSSPCLKFCFLYCRKICLNHYDTFRFHQPLTLEVNSYWVSLMFSSSLAFLQSILFS